MTKYLPHKLHQELAAAGIPVISVDENGICQFDPAATPQQLIAAHQVIDAHTPVPTQDELEISGITQQTLIKMVLSLWDMVVEKKLDTDIKFKAAASQELTQSFSKASDLHAYLVEQHVVGALSTPALMTGPTPAVGAGFTPALQIDIQQGDPANGANG